MKKQVIEHAGIPVGIMVPEQDHFRFIAVKFHVYALNDQRFASAQEIRQAIRRLLADDGHLAAAA